MLDVQQPEFLPGHDDLPVYGTYYGSDLSDPDTEYPIEITSGYYMNSRKYGINYLPVEMGDRSDLENPFMLSYISAFKEFYIMKNGSIPIIQYPEGFGRISKNGRKITIDYWYARKNDDNEIIYPIDTVYRTFVGIRI